MDELDIEYHRNRHKALLSTGNPKTTEDFSHKAQEEHSFTVQGGLNKDFLPHLKLTHSLTDDEAKRYMLYGAARRLRMIWVSYSSAIDVAPPDRSHPLTPDEQTEIGRDLNVIYINIVGVLDNYAWSLRCQLATEETRKLGRTKVGLFSRKFMEDEHLALLKPFLNEYSDWHEEIKSRRHPVAHRIPLYVPPAVLAPDEVESYNALEEQISEAQEQGNLELAQKLDTEQL